MPTPSQKGTGKKGGPGAMGRSQQQAGTPHARSRNTTPLPAAATSSSAAAASTSAAGGAAASASASAGLPPTERTTTDYLELELELIRHLAHEDLVDPSSAGAAVPDARSLGLILDRLETLAEIVDRRGTGFCDRGMRLLATTRKYRVDEVAREEAAAAAESGARGGAAGSSGAGDGDEGRRSNKKKRKAAEGLGPGDTKTEGASPLRDSGKPRKLSRDNDSASSSLSPVQASPNAMDVDGKGSKAGSKAKDDESSSESSSDEDDGRPKRPALPAAHTFGDDPSTFPDPTVYEIRPVTPGMSEEEKKQIYSVASYPKSDLSDLIAGDPPDKDFSNAKPSNQISFSTFASYIEPYFRPFTEEDLSFLRDRGDRVTPFNMPARGKRHYTEIWAEEDGTGPFDTPPPPPGGSHEPPNQARGSIDLMDDATAETDQLSVGPILARLLQTMRPEHRPPPADGDTVTAVPLPPYAGVVNGASSSFHDANGEDTTMVNGGDSQGAGGDGSNGILQLQPATYMAESATDVWKRPTGPKLEYSQLDERVKQELRHIGFLDAATTASPLSRLPDNLTNPNNPFPADYDGHYDDEVSARLRELQRRLRDQMLINGARKARLTELVKEHMAHQEYTTILEDLDGQVNGAYHKRTRTMGKSKKAKRPGGAGGGSHYVGGAGSGVGVASASGTARPGLGDATKLLLERRRRWIDNIGAVFEDVNLTKVPRADPKDGGGPETTIFKKEIMADLLRQERQAWEEEKALEEDEE